MAVTVFYNLYLILLNYFESILHLKSNHVTVPKSNSSYFKFLLFLHKLKLVFQFHSSKQQKTATAATLATSAMHLNKQKPRRNKLREY